LNDGGGGGKEIAGRVFCRQGGGAKLTEKKEGGKITPLCEGKKGKEGGDH